MIINFGNIGCALFAFLIFILMIAFKFWQLIFVLIILWYLSNKISDFFNKQDKKPKEYKAKVGKVYKQCSFCNAKADRLATHCPNCGKAFED